MSNVNSTVASKQWMSRPDDQRFLSLADLKASVESRKCQSWSAAPACRDLRMVVPDGTGELKVQVVEPVSGRKMLLDPSNWSFGQLASYAKVPASYARTLPAPLAAINLQWGLENAAVRDDALVLAQSNGTDTLRAMTSQSYGRIWDLDVVRAVEAANHDGRWQIPAASYATTQPKRATTLYASDRDVFIFLVDPENVIEVNDEKLFRGFYTWNSEVGSATFGIATFLYRYVCDNRIIWGMTEFKELRVRHTGGAPERFAHEGAKFLRRYAQESAADTVNAVRAAQDTAVPLRKDQTVEQWLLSRNLLTRPQAAAAVSYAKSEEGEARTFWELVNGITASARSVPNSDDRTALERVAGKLLDEVASTRTPDLTLPTAA